MMSPYLKLDRWQTRGKNFPLCIISIAIIMPTTNKNGLSIKERPFFGVE